MSNDLTITPTDILHKQKLSCQIPDIIEAIATEKIIIQTAKELGITVTEAELQQEGDNLRLEKKLATAKETWGWLDKHHLSVKDFEELVYKKIIAKKLAEGLFAPQVEKFFHENQINYEAAVTYEVIFEERDAALELFYALEEGEITFAEIARLYIQEPELRRAGGYRGVRYRKDFRPEIVAPVFAANPPQILKPITTRQGTYLIWVEEIIQPQLDDELRQKIISDSFTFWLKNKIGTLTINTNLEMDQVDKNNIEAQPQIVKAV